MGFKTKIILLAIIAALIGYIWYFNIEWSITTIIFTGAIVFICLIDWNLDNPFKARQSLKLKLTLFAILGVLIFYVWYFNIPINQDVIVYLVLIVLVSLFGIFVSRGAPYIESLMRQR